MYSTEDEQAPTVKKLQKAPKTSEYSYDEPGLPKDDKEPPLLRMKEEAQSFFDLQKKSKSLTIEKKVEEVAFVAGPYKGYELSCVALCNTKYLKWVFQMSGLEKKAKDLIKKTLAKT